MIFCRVGAYGYFLERHNNVLKLCQMFCFLQATDSEELTIAEGEELEIIERDGEGWCKVTHQNYSEACLTMSK